MSLGTQRHAWYSRDRTAMMMTMCDTQDDGFWEIRSECAWFARVANLSPFAEEAAGRST